MEEELRGTDPKREVVTKARKLNNVGASAAACTVLTLNLKP
jgi:hypothetical protein